MKTTLLRIVPSGRLGRRLVVLGLLVLGTWLVLFDSHSVVNRIQWEREYVRLSTENRELEKNIQSISRDLEAVQSDEVVEKIAREQYGMRRPGESVYPVER